MEEDIRKQGMLFHQQQRFGKKWKRVWCVLFRESSCSISRLEFFEYKDGGNVEKNDKTLRKLQESKKVIRMADCIRVTEVDMDGCPRDTGSFLVETTEKIYVFAVDRNQLDDWTHKLCEIAFPMSWMEAGAKRGTLQRGNKVDEDKEMEDNSLYSGQDRVRDFKVCIRRTDAADRCRLKGDGVLRADMEALHLVGKTGDVLYSWPYRYLRRFGRDKSTFSFEAGRRCNSGEGSFEFDTKQGNVLFQTVETAINLQKISLPHRQVSGGVPPEVTQNHLAPGHSRMPLSQPRSQVPQPPAFQAADGVYSMVTEPQSPQMILHRDMDSSNPPQLSQLEPPVDKVLTGVKSLTLDTRGLPVPRKNQVKMISSCPLPSASPEPGSNLTTGPCSNPTPRPKPGSSPNPSQTYSQISMSGVMGRDTKKDKRSINREPEYSLPFDTIASSVMGDLLLASQQGLGPGREAGADPLYDSIDEMKIRNIFKSPADSNRKVDHIYDEPEGCAIPSEEQKATPPPSVYDDPEEMRGGAWRCMGTTSDPTGHEYPYNPCVDDYAVPKRAQRAFVSQQSFSKEEEEEEDDEEDEEEEEQFSTYDNVMVKMG